MDGQALQKEAISFTFCVKGLLYPCVRKDSGCLAGVWSPSKKTLLAIGSAWGCRQRHRTLRGWHSTSSAITTYFLGENRLKIVFNIVDDNFSGFITCFLFTVWLPAPLPSASPLIHLLLSQHSSLHLLLIFILLPS